MPVRVRDSSSPLAASDLTTSRITDRLAPNSVPSSASIGNGSPGLMSPRTMRAPNSSATWANRLRFRLPPRSLRGCIVVMALSNIGGFGIDKLYPHLSYNKKIANARKQGRQAVGELGMSAEGGAPVLSMRGIGKRYPGVVALDDVELSLQPGEVHGLVGENGAGKSTLIKILSGAIHADIGEITIGGKPVD